MSVDLYASLRQPIQLKSLRDNTLRVSCRLLQLSEPSDVPLLIFEDKTRHNIYSLRRPGQALNDAQLRAIRYDPDTQSRSFWRPRASTGKTIVTKTPDGHASIDIMPSPSKSDWLLVFTPHGRESGKFWAAAHGNDSL